MGEDELREWDVCFTEKLERQHSELLAYKARLEVLWEPYWAWRNLPWWERIMRRGVAYPGRTHG